MLTRVLFVVFCWLTVTVAYFQIAVPQWDIPGLRNLHDTAVAGTAPAPFQYRVLVSFVVSPFVDETNSRLTTAYAVFDAALFGLMLIALYAWLRSVSGETGARTGVLITTALLPTMFHWFMYDTGTMIETALLSWGLIWLTRMGFMRSSLPSQP